MTPPAFYTRAKVKAMVDENAARFEQVERATQELKEMLLRNQKEHREQMARLMETILQMEKKRKQIAKSPTQEK